MWRTRGVPSRSMLGTAAAHRLKLTTEITVFSSLAKPVHQELLYEMTMHKHTTHKSASGFTLMELLQCGEVNLDYEPSIFTGE